MVKFVLKVSAFHRQQHFKMKNTANVTLKITINSNMAASN